MANLFDQFMPPAPAVAPAAPVTVAAEPIPAEQPGLVADMAQGVFKGGRDFAQSTLNLSADVVKALIPGALITPGSKPIQLPEVDEPQRLPGQILEPLTQFGLAFLPVGKALGAFKAGAGWATPLVAGAVADFAAFEPAQQRLANLMTQYDSPLLNNAITKFLAADPKDGWAEGRLKNAIEGAALGQAGALLFTGVRSIARGIAGKGLSSADQTAIEDALRAIQPTDGVEKAATAVEKAPEASFMAEADTSAVAAVNREEIRRRAELLGQGLIKPEALLEGMPLPSLAKLNNPEALDARPMIEEVAKAIRQHAGEGVWDKPQTIDAVQNLAADMGQDPTLILKNLQALGAARDQVAAHVMAGIALTENLHDALPGLMKQVNAGTLTMEQFAGYEDLALSSLMALREAGSTLGRGLNVMKYAGQGNGARANIRRALDTLAITGDRASFRAQVAHVTEPGVVARVFHKVLNNRFWNVANEYWINALLSGPKTHMINMTSNAISGLVRPLEEGLGGVLTMKGAARKQAVVNMGRVYAGLAIHARDSLRLARLSLMNDTAILDPGFRTVEQGANHAIGGRLGRAVRSPTQLLTAEDEFFKQISYRSRVYADASAEGVRGGLKGRDLADFVDQRFRAAFDENGKGINAKAAEYAQEVTFTNPLNGGIGGWLQDGLQEFPALRQIMPFIRTPTNLFRQAWRHFPALGMLERKNRQVWTNGTAEQKALMWGQQVIGTALLTTASMLAGAGRITGAAPTDSSLRETFLHEHPAYSVRFGNTWLAYDRLDPLGMILGLTADWYQSAPSVSPDSADEYGAAMNWATVAEHLASQGVSAGTRGFSAAAKNVVSKSYLQSLTEALDALQANDPNTWQRLVNNRIGSLVPNVLRQINPDSHFREVRDWMDAVMSRVPGFSDHADPRYDFTGAARLHQGNPLVRTLSPSAPFAAPNDKVWKELDRLGAGFPPVPSSLGNVDLTQFRNKDGLSAFRRYNDLIAKQPINSTMGNLIDQPGYKLLSDNIPVPDQPDKRYTGSKISALRKILDSYRGVAKGALLSEHFTSKSGLTLQQAWINDRVNRAGAAAPGAATVPLQ